MAFTFAGQFTEAILATGSSGATLLPALTAHVYTVGTTTHVTLYTSRTKGTTTANPVTTDANGNLTFFVDPGQYDVVFTPPGGSLKRVNVAVPQDPLEDPGTYQPVDHTWVAGLAVLSGQIIEHSGTLYKATASFTLPGTFDTTNLTAVGGSGGLPTQTSNAGKLLTTDGSAAAWALTADDPQLALSGAVNPSVATFVQVMQQQMLDVLPPLGDDAVVHEQRFLNVTGPVQGYTRTLNAGSAAPASVTVDSGALAITAPGTALDVSYSLPLNPCVAPYFFVRARLETIPNSGTAEVGIINPSTGDRYAFQYIKDGSGVVSLKWMSRISGTTSAFAVGSPPSTLPATPTAIALLVAGKNQWCLIQYDNGAIHAAGVANPAVDVRTTANFAAFKPHFGVALATGTVAKIGHVSVGYPGGLGVINPRLVTYDDGTPYLRRGKYFFTVTLANSGASYDGEHCAVMSFDPNSLKCRIICRLSFPTGTQLGSMYAGSLTFSKTSGLWTAVMSSWGVGDWTTAGVDLYYGQTTEDVLDGRSVAVIAVALLPLNLSGGGTYANGSYDGALRYDSNTSTYYLACAETSARTAFTTQPALYSGTTLTTLTRVAHDTVNPGENPHWVRMNGAWWVMFTWANHILQYDPTTLANRTDLGNWLPNNSPDGFGTLTQGAPVLAVSGNTGTTYYVPTWDGSEISGNDGTQGGLLICKCTTTPTGHEFARRHLLRS